MAKEDRINMHAFKKYNYSESLHITMKLVFVISLITKTSLRLWSEVNEIISQHKSHKSVFDVNLSFGCINDFFHVGVSTHH